MAQIASHLAASAAAFRNAIGVNTHLDYTGSAYANLGAVQQALADLQITHVRDAFEAPVSATALQTLALRSVSVDAVVSPAQSVAWQLAQMQANASIIDLVEGPNESDMWTASYNGLTGFAATRAMQADVFAFVQGSTALAGKPVLQGSMARGASFSQVGNLSAASDYANIHAYFGTGNTPSSGLPALLAQAQLIAPGQATIASEGGYYTRPDATGGVSELAQAKDILNLVFDDWTSGVARTYLYELVDHGADPGNTDPELHFGLYRSDWTPKPAATALKNMETLLGGPGSVSNTGSLAYQINGLPGSGNSLLLQRADGSFVISLWNEVRNWDATAQADVATAAVPVSVDLQQSYRTISVYDPLVSATVPVATYGNSRHIDLSLLDHPVMVVLSPDLAPVQQLVSVVSAKVAEGGSLGNVAGQILAAAAAADPGRAYSITGVSLGSTHGFVTFDQGAQSLTYLANGYDAAAPVDSFTYTLTDSLGQTIAGIYNVTMTGAAMPTVVSTVAGKTLYAASSGMRLISEASGQRLNGAAAGGDLFFAGADTAVAAYGTGNTIIAAPGNHGSIATGAGGATVRMGDGNQVVVAPGSNNSITLGTGSSSVSSTGNNETVVIAGGSNTVYVSGTGNRVTTGSGADLVTALGGGAAVDAGDGDNRVTVSGTGNTVRAGAGADLIQGVAGASSIDAGAGNDTIRFGGSGSTIIGGLGDDTISDSGGGNTILLNRAGEGTDQVYGNLPGNGDTFDLRTALSGTAWDGTPATLGAFLQVSMSGNDATVLVSPGGSGAGTAVAVLHSIGALTLDQLVARSILPVAAPARIAVSEGHGTGNLWSLLTAWARQADPSSRGTYAVSSIDAGRLAGSARLDTASASLVYQATGYNPAAADDSLSVTLSDGLGHTVSTRLTLGTTGAALPTLTSAIAADTVRGTAAGQKLIAGAAGQTLVGAAAGGSAIYAGADARVLLYASGNTVQGLPGGHVISGGKGGNTVQLADGDNAVTLGGTGNSVTAGAGNNTVSAGSGNATVLLGNGNNTVTVTGAGNLVRVGAGTNTIRAGSGGQIISVAGGASTISVSGAGNAVTTGDGAAAITATGSASSFATGAGADTLTISGSGNSIASGAGDDTIVALGGGNAINAGLGNDTIRFAGTGSTVNGGGGNDTLYDSGAGNTLVLGGGGIDQVYGSVLSNGDVFDLRAALGQTAWTGTDATLAQFLQVRSDGVNATLSLNGTAGGAAADIAVLHGVGNATLATLLPHALVR